MSENLDADLVRPTKTWQSWLRAIATAQNPPDTPPQRPVQPSTERALRWPTTRLAWRLNLARGAVVLSVGLALLVAFGALQTHYADADESLRSTSQTVRGTVIDTWGGGKTDSMIRVDYEVGGRAHRQGVDVGSNEYRKGQSVTVYYDPNRPTRMTINGVQNMPYIAGLVAEFLLVFGVLFAGLGTYLVTVWLRTGIWLRRAPWQTCTTELRMDVNQRLLVQVQAAPESLLYRSGTTRLHLRGSRVRLGPWHSGEVWLCQSPGRRQAVLASPGGNNLARIRVPRTDRQRRRWQKAVHKAAICP